MYLWEPKLYVTQKDIDKNELQEDEKVPKNVEALMQKNMDEKKNIAKV